MSEVPESWLRDGLFRSPVQLIDIAHCQVYGNDPRPKTVSRWREYPTSTGRIDLLLAWPGVLVVVECKRGRASEGAVAQVLRYVGSLKTEDLLGCQIVPIVAAEEFDDLARSAARAADVTLVTLVPAVSCEQLDDNLVHGMFVPGGYAELAKAIEYPELRALPSARHSNRFRIRASGAHREAVTRARAKGSA